MEKYDPLTKYLSELSDNIVTLSFERIEEIIGSCLPPSAHRYREWGANDKHHVQVQAWLWAGWKVNSVDFERQIVTFVRGEKPIPKIEKTKCPEICSISEPKEKITPGEFEHLCREVLSKYFETYLAPREIENCPKKFDLVSSDKKIVGDAKYFTMVRGQATPPAKFSVIGEHVWLLEKVQAINKFLVFGNDRRVPVEWLKKYGHLVKDVKFFFLDSLSKKLGELN